MSDQLKTPAYSFIKERVELEFQKLNTDKITPWVFFPSKGLRLTDFLGDEINYSGISFDGSPRNRFWNFIQPFIQDIVSRSFTETRNFCLSQGLEREQPLEETAFLLKSAICGVYDRMSNIDQSLRGKGYPNSVPKYNTISERTLSEAFVDERLAAELGLYQKKIDAVSYINSEKRAGKSSDEIASDLYSTPFNKTYVEIARLLKLDGGLNENQFDALKKRGNRAVERGKKIKESRHQ